MTEEAQNKIYILDTNVLIELNRWIPIDASPAFWSLLEKALDSGHWILLDIVSDEITYPKTLVAWCKRQKLQNNITKIEDAHRQRGVEINNQYKMIDDTSGRSEADTYLIAYAEANKLTIFSREGAKKPNEILNKIPDVCQALGVGFIRDPEQFYKNIGLNSATFSSAIFSSGSLS